MDAQEVIKRLQFSDRWLDLGVVTESQLEQFGKALAAGDDTNPEHYRWRAFTQFIASQQTLDDETAKALYKLGESDPDFTMGGSMMAVILQREDCPSDLLEAALFSARAHLRKMAETRKARR